MDFEKHGRRDFNGQGRFTILYKFIMSMSNIDAYRPPTPRPQKFAKSRLDTSKTVEKLKFYFGHIFVRNSLQKVPFPIEIYVETSYNCVFIIVFK